MNFCRPLAASVLPFALALIGAGNVLAASSTYTGTGGTFEAGPWSAGVPGDTTAGDTTDQDIATFALAAGSAVTEASNRNLLGITFGGGSSGSFTIGTTTGGEFLLSSGGSILANSSASSNTVNAPLVLENAAAATNGTYTFESDTPGTSRTTTIGGSITGAATSGSTVLTLTGTSSGPAAGNVISGAITDGAGGGNLALSKTGTGTWSINGTANTFSGGTTVTAGTLRTGSSGNTSTIFGTGTLTFNGGTLVLGSTTATTVNTAVAVNAGTTSYLTLRTNDTFNPTAMTGTGALVINNSNTPSNTLTTNSFQNFGGTIEVATNAGSPNILRFGTSYAQNSLQNGTLLIDSGSSVTQQSAAGTGATVNVSIGALAGTGTIGGSAASTGTFVYNIGNNNASTTFSGTITPGSSGTALTKVGTGTLTLTGGNTYVGSTTISAGALAINADTSVGAPASATAVTLNGGALVGIANFALDNGSATTNARGITLTATTGGILAATTGNTMTVDGVVTGSGPLTIGTGALTANSVATTGNGTVVLSAANNYSGGTTVAAGTLNINGLYALGGANYAGITFNGGTLQYAAGTGTAFSTTYGGGDISNFGGVKTVTISAGGATIDTNNNNVTYASPIGNGGAGGLTKVGAGSLELQAAATYTGATTINAGTLLLSTGSINASPTVTVNAGALTLQNATALDDAGTLTLASGTTLNLDGANGTSEIVAGLTVNGTVEGPGTYSAGVLNGVTFESEFGETLTVVAVPEPTTVLGGLLLMVAAGWNQRRRLMGISCQRIA